MYLRFYGLTEKPFELTPNPKFLFQTPGHREALAQLIYGTQEQKGFMLMTGEVGTGKTTLLRALAQRLNGKAECAFVINSTLAFDELLEYALADLGVADPGGSRAQRLMALNRFLIGQHRAGRQTILIIDEAQNLRTEALEQIRLLSNFETGSGKLLQIILAGQPELGTKLQQPELRQLKQRIALRCRLQPLSEDEIEQYIMNHFRVAGARDLQPFTAAAIRQIARYSGGIPRVVNMVCDHSLLIGYANQARQIDVDTARKAIQYLEDGTSSEAWKPAGRRLFPRPVIWAAGGIVGGMAVLATIVSLGGYRPGWNAMPWTVVAGLGGVVRWLMHWWGS